jgi:TP901 family phage tail tape measure protein
MPTIDLRVDAGQAESSLNRLVAQLQAVEDRIAKVTSTSATFNAQGERVGAVVRGLTHDGKEFAAVWEQVRDSTGKVHDQLKKISYKEKAREIEEVAEKTNSWHEILGRVQRSLQYFVTYRSFSFITDQIRNGIQASKDFQIQLSLIRTLSQENQQSFAKFGQDVRGVSDRSGVDINQVGKAFYDTISNQIAKGGNTAAFVEQAANLSRVTGSELPDSVNLLSSAINAYGLSITDAERLSAVFFKTIDEGRVVSSELANTFGRVAVLGSNLGINLEEINSVIAITTQKGFKTADAMTLLTNLMIKLEKPTEATQAFFSSLGVSTGEAAIKLLGFNGVLKRMVDAVKTGQVDVSAFFDEIRGRKQFGVFEQSVDEIETFADKLKNTTEVMKTYNKALDIRGESPADKLVKEFNKIQNIFTVDFGQGILKFTADLLQMVGGVDAVTKVSDQAGAAVRTVGIVLAAYAVTAVGAAAANAGVAASFYAVAGAGAVALRTILPLAAAYGGFELGKSIFGSNDTLFGKVDPTTLYATADAIDRVRQRYDSLKDSVTKANVFATLDAQGAAMSKTFQDAIGLVAGANRANNGMLGDLKEKSKLASEAIKTGFGAYTDVLKRNISEIKKGITEATNEIEKSKKSMLGFKDSLDRLLFETKSKYANENFGGDFGQVGGQKSKLLDQQIGGLRERAYQLFGLGTPEAADEARKLFDEIAKLEKERFEFQTDLTKKQAEAAGATGIFFVDTLPLQDKLNKLLAERNALEAKYTTEKKQQITDSTKQESIQSTKLDKLQAAMKAYENLDVFGSTGSVKSEFRSPTGKFEPEKLNKEVRRLEDDIRNNYTGSFEDRLGLEKLLFDKRTALVKEAAAQERADYLQTTEQRILGEQEVYQKKLADIKKVRQEEIDRQKILAESIGSKANELVAFGGKAVSGGGASIDDIRGISQRVKAYKAAVQKLYDDQTEKDGLKLFKPENLAEAKAEYDAALREILRVRDKAGQGTDLTLQDANGRNITPGTAKEAFELQIQEFQQSMLKLRNGLTEEKVGGQLFDETIGKPLEKLKAQFPELANSAKTATGQMGQSFRELANGGLEDLRKKLEEVQKLMLMNGGKINAELGAGGQPAFMATGGIVGAFPGQPRGADRYPIWAAKGEYIVNARSSAMFKPMLEAINNARAPRYMAGGGMVGSNTTIGDINVNVTGASTNDATGRAVASKLERLLRRNNINLNRR